MKTNKRGFTLVEILIVVVILGILAAIVIPQFTNASTEAKESSLAADLQTMRSQIELYKIQHSDQAPDSTSSATFASALLVADANGFGPYMGKIPTNPFVLSVAGSAADANDISIDGALDNGYGWNYDTTAKVFKANDTAHSTK